ncbi:MAG: hypothetical protein ACOYNI_07735 [Acidimicrobiia bacterium]
MGGEAHDIELQLAAIDAGAATGRAAAVSRPWGIYACYLGAAFAAVLAIAANLPIALWCSGALLAAGAVSAVAWGWTRRAGTPAERWAPALVVLFPLLLGAALLASLTLGFGAWVFGVLLLVGVLLYVRRPDR